MDSKPQAILQAVIKERLHGRDVKIEQDGDRVVVSFQSDALPDFSALAPRSYLEWVQVFEEAYGVMTVQDDGQLAMLNGETDLKSYHAYDPTKAIRHEKALYYWSFSTITPRRKAS